MKKNFEASNPPPNYNRSCVISQHKDICRKNKKMHPSRASTTPTGKHFQLDLVPPSAPKHVEVRGRESREINITARRAL